jgi:uridine phosphorylase
MRAGASALVSFGIAGGLDPALDAGRVILSGEVVGEAGRWVVPEALYRGLAALAPTIGAVAGTVLGAERILATSAGKALARTRTGALAVDLESAIVARQAAEAGLPFIVLRAVADRATDELPQAALLPLHANGTPRLASVLGCVLRRPGEIARLVRLAGQTRRALDALRDPAQALRRFVEAF